MTDSEDIATKVEELEKENEKLAEEVDELKDKVSELEYDLEWYECDHECDCNTDELLEQLQRVRKNLSSWHSDNHYGSLRFCSEELCKEIEDATYGYH